MAWFWGGLPLSRGSKRPFLGQKLDWAISLTIFEVSDRVQSCVYTLLPIYTRFNKSMPYENSVSTQTIHLRAQKVQKSQKKSKTAIFGPSFTSSVLQSR